MFDYDSKIFPSREASLDNKKFAIESKFKIPAWHLMEDFVSNIKLGGLLTKYPNFKFFDPVIIAKKSFLNQVKALIENKNKKEFFLDYKGPKVYDPLYWKKNMSH